MARLKVFWVTVFLFLHLLHYSKSKKTDCIDDCGTVCVSTNEIDSKSCDEICSNHCSRYPSLAIQNEEQIKCLLLCYNLYLTKSVCDTVCKVPNADGELKNRDANTNNDLTKYTGDGCTGNGRETCYKLCRLEHSAGSILFIS
jgi:hypothetical protein